MTITFRNSTDPIRSTHPTSPAAPAPVPASRRRRAALASTAVAATALLVLGTPLAASAHVHVHPNQAAAGADEAMLTFEVPNESATATTTKVVFELPTTDVAFGEVSYEPVPGWTGTVVTAKLAKPVQVDGAPVDEVPSRIEFDATGTGIADGQEQTFTISVGPVPSTGKILLPVEQTYSDGSVVRWDQAIPAGGEEPEHPAPVLYITDAPPADAGDTVTSATSNLLPLVLAGGALVVALLALVVALIAVTRTRGRAAVRPGTTRSDG